MASDLELRQFLIFRYIRSYSACISYDKSWHTSIGWLSGIQLQANLPYRGFDLQSKTAVAWGIMEVGYGGSKPMLATLKAFEAREFLSQTTG